MAHDLDLWSSLAETAAEGIWVVDVDGHTIGANSCLARLLGRDPADLRAVTPCDVWGQVSGSSDRAGQALVVTAICGDGTSVRLKVQQSDAWSPRGVRAGTVFRVESAGSDGPPGPMSETELLRLGQTITRVGSWTWELTSGELWWSQELYEIYGVDPLEAPSVEASQRHVHPDDLASLHRELARAEDGATSLTWEGRLRHPSDGSRWVRERARVVRNGDGEIIRMHGTSQDVTDLRDANARASRARKRTALLQQVTAAANRASTVAEALQLAAEALIRYTPWDPLVAVDVHACSLLPLARRPWVLAEQIDTEMVVDRTLAEGTVTEVAVWGPGKLRSLIGIPVVLEGQVLYVAVIGAQDRELDIDVIDTLHQVGDQLSRVARRELAERELASARDAAMEAARMRQDLLAMMSHDLRSPLAGISAVTELLVTTELDEHQLRMVSLVRESGATLLALIENVLQMTQIESGQFALATRDFELRPAVESAVALVVATAHAKGLDLSLRIDPELPSHVRGDSGRLVQLVANLAGNAVKFTADGEVRVECRRSTTEDPDEVRVRLDVVDSGVGFDNSTRQKLFAPFNRGERDDLTEVGTGLGLSISKVIVGEMRGHIDCDSESGRGSRFFAEFSLARSDAAVASSRTSLAAVTVVICEDHDGTADALGELLTTRGAEVRQARTYAAARSLCSDVEPDLFLVDSGLIGRPQIDDLLHLSQASSVLPVLLLAHGDPVPAELTAMTALAKPIREQELQEALSDALSTRRPV